MKTLGIIGGIGPESTIDYYRSLIAGCRARDPQVRYPPVIINSIDNDKLLRLAAAQELGALAAYLLAELEKLARAGADVALLAANTPHVVFDQVAGVSPLPLLSIVEATCAAAKAAGFRRLGLLGTRFTMDGDFYPKVFAREGLALVTPEPAEKEYAHRVYMEELLAGVFKPETRERLRAIVRRLLTTHRLDAIILGGTELPLILRDGAADDVPFLDTTRIHVNAAIERMLA